MVVTAYVMLTVSSGSERKVCEKIASYKEVVEVDELYGEYDVITKVKVGSLQQLDDLINRIRSNPNILLTYTMIIAKKHKG